METILSGDIGGTNARLAVLRIGGAGGRANWETLAAETYPTRDFQALEDVLREFLGKTGFKPVLASLGVAGVPRGNAVKMTNLPWRPDADRIARDLGFSRVLFLNDIQCLRLPAGHGPGFREAFVSKGRLTPIMEKIPVSVVTDGRLALLGAARWGSGVLVRDRGSDGAGKGAP